MATTTIVLADDHTMIRHGLRSLLEAEADFSIVGEAADGLEVLELVQRIRPDILVLDLIMPGLNGLEVVRRISKESPKTRVVILSMHANESWVLEALRNGAAAYVLKDSTAADLVNAVRLVTNGGRYLSPPISERAIETYIQRSEPSPLDSYGTLTKREREVLHLVVEGHGNTAIATRLSITPRTAETHRTNLMRKLGLRGQTALIRYAIQRGILPMEDSKLDLRKA